MSFEEISDRFHVGYRWFNNFEGAIWIGIALYILWRLPRHVAEHRAVLIVAACTFVLFGITDFIEAPIRGGMPLWLWAVKGVLLGILIACRLVYRRTERRLEMGKETS